MGRRKVFYGQSAGYDRGLAALARDDGPSERVPGKDLLSSSADGPAERHAEKRVASLVISSKDSLPRRRTKESSLSFFDDDGKEKPPLGLSPREI